MNTLLGYVPWGVIFAFVLWAIWLDRNSLIFSNRSVPSQVLQHNAVSHATEFFFLSSILTPSSLRKSSVLLRWRPAPFPFVTINTDGSSSGNPGPTGAGGLARTHAGTWLWGFFLNLGCTNNTVAKLWGIRTALTLAWDKGHRRVLLQSDSLLAVKWISTEVDFPVEITNLVLDCRWLLRREWEAHVEHVWRETNSYADALAKRGASLSEREILYDTCPRFLWQCLYWDSMGFCGSAFLYSVFSFISCWFSSLVVGWVCVELWVLLLCL